MRREVKVDGRTYRVSKVDTGAGPRDYVAVKVAIPGGIMVSHRWRPVPRGGKTWAKVMAVIERERAK